MQWPRVASKHVFSMRFLAERPSRASSRVVVSLVGMARQVAVKIDKRTVRRIVSGLVESGVGFLRNEWVNLGNIIDAFSCISVRVRSGSLHC